MHASTERPRRVLRDHQSGGWRVNTRSTDPIHAPIVGASTPNIWRCDTPTSVWTSGTSRGGTRVLLPTMRSRRPCGIGTRPRAASISSTSHDSRSARACAAEGPVTPSMTADRPVEPAPWTTEPVTAAARAAASRIVKSRGRQVGTCLRIVAQTKRSAARRSPDPSITDTSMGRASRSGRRISRYRSCNHRAALGQKGRPGTASTPALSMTMSPILTRLSACVARTAAAGDRQTLAEHANRIRKGVIVLHRAHRRSWSAAHYIHGDALDAFGNPQRATLQLPDRAEAS